MVFWLASVLIGVRARLPQWTAALGDLTGLRPQPGVPGPLSGLLRLVEVVDLVPPLLLVLALAAVVGAPLRGRLVERRYRLGPAGSPPVAAEIEAFVRSAAPRMAVRANMRRLDIRAFAYTRGYRAPAFAVCGGMAILWRRDRPAAETVIRHELAHAEQGDSLLLGTLSPVDAVLRRWLWLVLGFGVIPVALAWAAQAAAFLENTGSPGAGHTAAQFLTLILPGLGLLVVTATAQVLAAITMPIAASWSAELAADGAVGPDRAAFRRALGGPHPGGFRRWLRGRITHPPAGLRRALAPHVRGQALAAALIYPAAWLIQLLWLAIQAASASAQEGLSLAGILQVERGGVAAWASADWPLWAAAGAVLALWPALDRPWKWALSGIRAARLESGSA